MKILVTGAAGFIGSHSVERLLAEGHEVIGVDNLRSGTLANLARAADHPRFQLEQMDVCDAPELDELVARTRPAAILHLAALVSVQECRDEPALAFSLNVQATHRVAEAGRRHGVARMVFASSAAVYGAVEEWPTPERADRQPLGPYGAAKLASEALLQGHAAAYGLAVVCLRYFNVYGPRQDASSPYSGVISAFAARFRRGVQPVIHGDGSQSRDFISVHDVAKANVLALTHSVPGYRALNICTGRETSVLELAAMGSRAFGLSGVPEFVPARSGDIRRSVGDPTRARTEIGFEAGIPVEQGLAAVFGHP